MIAFIVVGPKDLPKVARAIARGLKRLKLMLEEVKKETGIDEIETEMKSVQTEVRKTMKTIDVRADLKESEKEIDRSLAEAGKEISDTLDQTRREVRESVQTSDARSKKQSTK